MLVKFQATVKGNIIGDEFFPLGKKYEDEKVSIAMHSYYFLLKQKGSLEWEHSLAKMNANTLQRLYSVHFFYYFIL